VLNEYWPPLLPPYGTVLLFAKSAAAAAALAEQFNRGRVHHYFVALSARTPSKKNGTVSGELTKIRKGAYKLSRVSIVGSSNPGSGSGSGGGGSGGGGPKGGGGTASSAMTRFVSRGVAGRVGTFHNVSFCSRWKHQLMTDSRESM
jgi:hypothetical protein